VGYTLDTDTQLLVVSVTLHFSYRQWLSSIKSKAEKKSDAGIKKSAIGVLILRANENGGKIYLLLSNLKDIQSTTTNQLTIL
jgi:hypothetical protein